jgi:serine/threonine-protein kinase RsbT
MGMPPGDGPRGAEGRRRADEVPMKVDREYVQTFPIRGGNFANAGAASVEVKSILVKMGLDNMNVRRIAIAVYEAEMNVVLYARKGEMTLRISPERVFVIVEDEGRGIEDIPLAMSEGYTTADESIRELGFGGGMGLPNIRRNADYVRISSAPMKGTRLEVGFDVAGDSPPNLDEEKTLTSSQENGWNICVWKIREWTPCS